MGKIMIPQRFSKNNTKIILKTVEILEISNFRVHLKIACT